MIVAQVPDAFEKKTKKAATKKSATKSATKKVAIKKGCGEKGRFCYTQKESSGQKEKLVFRTSPNRITYFAA